MVKIHFQTLLFYKHKDLRSKQQSHAESPETPPTEDDFKVVNGRNGKQNLANKLFHTKDTGLERSQQLRGDRSVSVAIEDCWRWQMMAENLFSMTII